jgi:hypothetical protein
LDGILAYPPEIKDKIFVDSFTRLGFIPTLTAKQIPFGLLEGYWARLGLYQVILIYQVDEDNAAVQVHSIKHKRENMYWK